MNCKQAVLSGAQKCRQTHGCLASPLCSRRLITHGQIHEFTGKWAGPQAMLPAALPCPWHKIPQQVLARRNRRSGRTGCPRWPVYLAPLRRLNRTASDVPVAPDRWPEFRLLVRKMQNTAMLLVAWPCPFSKPAPRCNRPVNHAQCRSCQALAPDREVPVLTLRGDARP